MRAAPYSPAWSTRIMRSSRSRGVGSPGRVVALIAWLRTGRPRGLRTSEMARKPAERQGQQAVHRRHRHGQAGQQVGGGRRTAWPGAPAWRARRCRDAAAAPAPARRTPAAGSATSPAPRRRARRPPPRRRPMHATTPHISARGAQCGRSGRAAARDSRMATRYGQRSTRQSAHGARPPNLSVPQRHQQRGQRHEQGQGWPGRGCASCRLPRALPRPKQTPRRCLGRPGCLCHGDPSDGSNQQAMASVTELQPRASGDSAWGRDRLAGAATPGGGGVPEPRQGAGPTCNGGSARCRPTATCSPARAMRCRATS